MQTLQLTQIVIHATMILVNEKVFSDIVSKENRIEEIRRCVRWGFGVCGRGLKEIFLKGQGSLQRVPAYSLFFSYHPTLKRLLR